MNAVDMLLRAKLPTTYFLTVCVRIISVSSYAMQVGTLSLWPVLSSGPSIILNLFPLCKDVIFPR